MKGNDKLKQQLINNNNQPIPNKNQSILQTISSDTFIQEIKKAIPTMADPKRFVRIIITELRKTPALLEVDKSSFLLAVMQVAQMGLDPASSLGYVYILPFYNKKKNIKEASLIIGYKGMLELARRSGNISSIEARIVREKDHFVCEYGLNSKLEHIPYLDGDAGEIRFVYALAKFKDGGYQFEVMNKKEIDKIKSTSKNQNQYSIWNTHYEEMAKKTALRRIFKYLPISTEIMQMIVQEDQNNGVIDVVNANYFKPIDNIDDIDDINMQIENTQDEYINGTITDSEQVYSEITNE